MTSGTQLNRPAFLSVWVIILAFGGLRSSRSMYAYFLLGVPIWIPLILVAQLLLVFIGLIMIWKWKKLGFYLLLAAPLLSIFVNMAIYSPTKAILNTAVGYIGVGILYLAMRPVWENFK